MTKKLFWTDPYATECNAEVTSIAGNVIKIDQTLFFAFSGGQESDKGTIGGIEVANAIKEGDKENIIDIAYELSEPPTFKVGDTVTIQINKERRYNLMKLHSAVHLLYYILEKEIGKFTTIGSHIAEQKARLDLLWQTPISPLLPSLQGKLNTLIAGSHSIQRETDSNNPDMWWWICNGWRMPCGGTHVKTTNEIGSVNLKRVNIGRGKERIEIILH